MTTKPLGSRTPGTGRLVAGNISLDCEGHYAAVGGKAVHLTHQEFELLTILANHQSEIIDRSVLGTMLWGGAGPREFKRLSVIVARLREKLADAAPFRIETVRHRGYGLVIGARSG